MYLRKSLILLLLANYSWVGQSVAIWNNRQDAIRKLWRARISDGKSFPIRKCNSWGQLNAFQRRFASYNPQSMDHLVIPWVNVNHNNLTPRVAQMGQILLRYVQNRLRQQSTQDPRGWLPVSPLNIATIDFWKQTATKGLREAHGNGRRVLPNPVTVFGQGNIPAWFSNPAMNQQTNLPGYCPPNLRNPPGAEGHNNILPYQITLLHNYHAAGLTNQMKWHCYAFLQPPPALAPNPGHGFIEITGVQEFANYGDSIAEGRFVFDYLNGHVYYSPIHYRQWKKGLTNPAEQFAPDDSQHNTCATPGACCTSFFRLVD